MDNFWSALERTAARDVGRGSASLARYTRGNVRKAAVSLVETGADVAILTGFFVGSAAETDGPLGAVQVASAISFSGGIAKIITDDLCAPVLRAAIRAADCPATVERTISGRESHLIAIERPGPSWGGGPPRNMRGEDISQWAPPLDFPAGPWTRIAIGDGGNELGMGSLPHSAVVNAVPNGDLIHCSVDCDLPIIGGTSNWASAAVVAGMSHLSPKVPRDLLTSDWSHTVLHAIVTEAGAVDGVLRRPSQTVDGLTWPEYASVLNALAAL